jgi:hypothetical protein
MTVDRHHNQPPRERLSSQLDDLLDEARLWLDGSPCADQAQADGLAQLLADARKIAAALEAERKAEAEPFDRGKAAVQAAYKPLLGKADTLQQHVKAALADWMARQQQVQREAEDAARREAEALAERAREVRGDGLAGALVSDTLLEQADAARAAADKLAREKAGAKAATGGRKVTLRTVTEPVAVEHPLTALLWALTTRPDELRAWLLGEARRALPARVAGIEYQEREIVQ